VQVQIYEAMRRGDEDKAEALYREVLPLIVFVMQSIEASLTYGKRITARRLGIEAVHDRDPALAPTDFGLAVARARSAHLMPFPLENT
jgi:4-hydroxy-tetrahydrodipicolinate synthase